MAARERPAQRGVAWRAHAGHWTGCGRPAGSQLRTYRSARPRRLEAAVKSRLLLLQKQISKISLRPVVTIWQLFPKQQFAMGRHEGRRLHQSADICAIAARICGGICSVKIKGRLERRRGRSRLNEAARRKMSETKGCPNAASGCSCGTLASSGTNATREPASRRRLGPDAESNLHRCEDDGASLAVLSLGRSCEPCLCEP